MLDTPVLVLEWHREVFELATNFLFTESDGGTRGLVFQLASLDNGMHKFLGLIFAAKVFSLVSVLIPAKNCKDYLFRVEGGLGGTPGNEMLMGVLAIALRIQSG